MGKRRHAEMGGEALPVVPTVLTRTRSAEPGLVESLKNARRLCDSLIDRQVSGRRVPPGEVRAAITALTRALELATREDVRVG